MEKLTFCPKCGTKLDGEYDFCPQCGYNLKKYIAENMDTAEKSEPEKAPQATPASINKPISQPIKVSTEAAKSQSTPQPQSQPEQTESAPVTNKPKKNKGLGWILVLVVVLIGAYFLGNMYFSEARQAQTLQDEVTSGTTSKMQNALVDVNGNQLSNSQIGSLKRLYLKDSTAIRNIESQISASQGSNQAGSIFSLKKTGRYFLLYPKYRIAVKSKSLTVETNIDNPSFSIDGKKLATKSDDGEYRISGLTPGVYDLKISGANNQIKEKQISLGVNNEDTEVEMDVAETVKEPSESKSKSDVKDDATTDDNDDEKTDSNDDDNNDSSSSDSLVGSYTGDPDLELYSDGTYDLGDKTGTYDILENNDGHVRIRYNQDGGGSITESYDYSDGELHSSKYDQSWYKD